MKLKQIIKEQIDHRSITTRKPDRELYKGDDSFEYDDDGNIISGQDKERLGKGSFSVVYPDKEDPHMVKKLGRDVGNKGFNRKKSDFFLEYAKWITDNNLASKNIHFPRIYETSYDEENDIHDYKMERLQPYTSLSSEALWGLAKKYFDRELILKKKWFNERDDQDTNKFNLQVMITDSLDDVLTYKKLDMIRDSELLKAAKLVSSEVNKPSRTWRYDIHSDNVMYRLTSVGPQLVLSDIIY